jgi:vacuolar protein sorting-associated protein 45
MRGTLDLVDELIRYSGAGVRTCDLFGTGASVFSKLSQSVKRGMSNVQNVYTQHQPLLTSVLDQLARGKLSRTSFPFSGPEPPAGKFSTVIVFYVGGATYEEAAKVAAMNNGSLSIGGGGGAQGTAGGPVSAGAGPSGPPFRVVLGGTTMHNAKSFLAELQRLGGNFSVDVGGSGGSSSSNAAAGVDLR